MAFSNVLRGLVHAEALFWIEARDAKSGSPATLGIWTGGYNKSFEVNGELRDYVGAGGLLSIGNLLSRIGIVVQRQTVKLSGLKPEIEDLFRGYDARNAPVQIHSVRRDLETNAIIATDEVFKGFLNKAPTTVGSIGGSAAISCELVSSARLLTRKLAHVKSDAAQGGQDGDGFLKYADFSGTAEVYWGMERVE